MTQLSPQTLDRLRSENEPDAALPFAKIKREELIPLLDEVEFWRAGGVTEGFDVVGHLSLPSRVNPLASAAAVNLTKRSAL